MQVPALAYNVAYAVDADHVIASPGYRVLSHVRNLLVNVNSAVNFLLYCVFGQKFRRVFLQTFCAWCPACCRRRDDPDGSANVSGLRSTRVVSSAVCGGGAGGESSDDSGQGINVHGPTGATVLVGYGVRDGCGGGGELRPGSRRCHRVGSGGSRSNGSRRSAGGGSAGAGENHPRRVLHCQLLVGGGGGSAADDRAAAAKLAASSFL